MDMISESLQEMIREWTEQLIGVPISALGGHPMPVLTPDGEPRRSHPLVIIRCGTGSALIATQELCDAVRPIMSNLHADLVFSPFGTYELARATLPLGITIWGPSFYLFGDRNTVSPASDERVVEVGTSELAEVDYSIFWHCQQEALAGFAVYDGRRTGRSRNGYQPWRTRLGDRDGDAPGRAGERTRSRGRKRRRQLDSRKRPNRAGDRGHIQHSFGENAAIGRAAVRIHDHRRQTGTVHGATSAIGQPASRRDPL